eukprot:CAMPEP_0203669364 /NCGR_PEP_ID=MMETSP0090-20130426/5774_1 /ASSEMBLY_ACC=CAM_ASM_001088 /TAXON_ID=426623 /ORGANISM="Chaetoceros affinis, Strain CCMP159" /LENGTH=456 /DNA_ID=CAMNT_0050534045 /DNA_START=1 /DNA_END=1371 /DNA_ORIENTATION=+
MAISLGSLRKRSLEEELQLNPTHIFLVITGILLGMDIILALRSTFLPFAKFAGALFVITLTLIPFAIVSVVIILCFTYIYRMAYTFSVGGMIEEVFDDESLMKKMCEESFVECLFSVFGVFFAADTETSKLLDIIFGFIVVVVLLTIVIAIVSDAWNGVGEEAAQMYWESRISFLANIQTIPGALKKRTPSFMKKIGESLTEKIDQTESMYFAQNQRFSWTKDAPYNEVSTKDEYDHPFEYFPPEKATIIYQARSFKSDVYWIRADTEDPFEFRFGVLLKMFEWILHMSLYFCFIILGLITFGFFWPRGLRRSILSYGYGNADKNSHSNVDDVLNKMFIDIMGSSTETAENLDPKSKLEMISKEIKSHYVRENCRKSLTQDLDPAKEKYGERRINRSLLSTGTDESRFRRSLMRSTIRVGTDRHFVGPSSPQNTPPGLEGVESNEQRVRRRATILM